MPVEWLLQWWNAIYALPLACVLALLAITSLVSLVSGGLGELTHNDADADHDVDVGHDADVDHDADLDHDLEVDHDLDVDQDLDVEHEIEGVEHVHSPACGHAVAGHADPGPVLTALMAIGVGKAPLMLVLQILVLLWGAVGLLLHQAVAASGPGVLLWSVPITLLVSLVGTRAFAGVFARLFKPFESSAVKQHQMVGRSGKVVYPVNAEEGTISIRDQYGTLHRVRARTQHEALDCGQEVVVIGYDPGQRVFEVDDAQAFVERR